MATREDVILKNARSVEALLTNPAHKDAIEELALWALELQRDLGRVKAQHADELRGWDQRFNLVQMERYAEQQRRKEVVAKLDEARKRLGELELRLLNTTDRFTADLLPVTAFGDGRL